MCQQFQAGKKKNDVKKGFCVCIAVFAKSVRFRSAPQHWLNLDMLATPSEVFLSQGSDGSQAVSGGAGAAGSSGRTKTMLDVQTSARLSAFTARLRALQSPMIRENAGELLGEIVFYAKHEVCIF